MTFVSVSHQIPELWIAIFNVLLLAAVKYFDGFAVDVCVSVWCGWAH